MSSPEYQLDKRLPATAGTVRVARRAALAACVSWRLGPLCDRLAVVVSELVTNVVRAGGRWLTLRVSLDERRLRVEVHDEQPGRPVLRRPPADAESGRGMLLISRLTTRWGVDEKAVGKSVWVEFDLVGSSGPAA